MGKNKKIYKKENSSGKSAKISLQNKYGIDSFHDLCLSWQLKILDLDHNEWGWKNLKQPALSEVIEKLKNFETMAWKEVLSDKKNFHSVGKIDLDKKAQKRLEVLQLDEIPNLFRLRLSGTARIWGIIDRYIFKILWWDPEHTVCPSSKINT